MKNSSVFTYKHTILLGLGVGLVGIGIMSFFVSSQLQLVYINEALEPDQTFSYNFTSLSGALQKINISGSEFEYSFTKPGSNTTSTYKANKISSSWNFDSDGTSMVKVINIGNNTVNLEAEFIQLPETVWDLLYKVTLALGSIFLVTSFFSARKR